MSLSYTKPGSGLDRELREVARDAEALSAALTTGLNVELPADFPKTQLLDVTRSLAQLPNGTAEGCRAALEYARNRLPAIRREHVVSEEVGVANGAAKSEPVLRDSSIDERLRHLIASTTTALDEYRRLTAEMPEEELKQRSVSMGEEVSATAIRNSLSLEPRLAAAKSVLESVVKSDSAVVESLERQIEDGQGLNRLARAELRMQGVVPSWFRNIVSAMSNIPRVIRGTTSSIRLGIDIMEIGLDRWHDFEKNTSESLLKEFRKTCDSFIAVAVILEGKRDGSKPPLPSPSQDINVPRDVELEARAMILDGRAPPVSWRSSIRTLTFGGSHLKTLALLSELTELEDLDFTATAVKDLSPLAELSFLKSLEFRETPVTDLTALSGLRSLRYLDMTGSPVSDIAPLSQLIALDFLNLSGTQVVDLRPLSALTSLRILRLYGTRVADLTGIASLTSLQELHLQATGVEDITKLGGLTALHSLFLRSTLVSDISSLASLYKLRQLDLRETSVQELSPLAHIQNLYVAIDSVAQPSARKGDVT